MLKIHDLKIQNGPENDRTNRDRAARGNVS